MFNTLGNFVVFPQAGLVFIDFDRKRALQLSGRAKIFWEADDPGQETGGTNRYWDFHVERWLDTTDAVPLEWEFLDFSPHNPGEK